MGEIWDDRMPFHVLVPFSPGGVVEIFEQSAALHMGIVERGSVRNLGEEWNVAGTYILLERHEPGGNWGAYVGKAPSGIAARLRSHAANRDHWYRAVLIRRDTRHGYTSAHTAWLEGRLYDLLNSAARAELRNAQRPGDDTLPSYDLPMLESAVEPISRLLRIIGHDPAPEEEPELSGSKRARANFRGTTVLDLIESGLLSGDEMLYSTWATVPAMAQLLPTGELVFEGTTYKSPSAAGSAARGGGAANGWSMWAVKTPTGLVRLATLRARLGERLEPRSDKA